MRKITRRYLEAFLRRHASDLPVVDIGAGSTEYESLFPNRTTFDIDPARKPDIVGSIESMPFSDGSQRLLICSEVLEHVERPERAVSELRRVLAPGGKLILTTRFAFPVHDAPGDYWRFTPYGLRRLFDGWEVDEFATDGGAFTAIAILLQRIALQSKLRGGKLTKVCLYAGAWLFSKLDGLVVESYGDIRRTSVEPHLLSAGVYLVARKKA